ncbi:DNA polymerase IV [Curvivirga sp.]|uniref:DNA polymerase IV n=1 Tax=Curvivirga sp. TaxID=2856848 RepID=UPI003B5B5CD2
MQDIPNSPNCLCRDCSHIWYMPEQPRAARCPDCNSPRLKYHSELALLSTAHIDCDSFYATVEKRDDPSLADKPVIVGGGQRGVVSAACYVARMYGVRSAMPMFKAKQLCPDLVVIRPNMAKYSKVGKEIRKMMHDITPMVEPISIDEAFLDLSGTEKLHKAYPAQTLSRFIKRIEDEVGVTASVGLSHNKFLAKIASDLEKPKGFAVIGKEETMDFLGDKPVTLIWGVGKALAKTLHNDGIEKIHQLRAYEKFDLMGRYGSMGKRLYHFCRGEDDRSVSVGGETKSISNETTFNTDISDYQTLENTLWKLCDNVSQRMKKQNLAARTVVLKLKTKDFKQITRNRTLIDPTMLAEQLFRVGKQLLKNEADGRAFRLLGIGGAELVEGGLADPIDLADPDGQKRAKIENTMDLLRDKLGNDAIIKGRSLK